MGMLGEVRLLEALGSARAVAPLSRALWVERRSGLHLSQASRADNGQPCVAGKGCPPDEANAN